MHSRNHAGENVARAASRHSGIPRRIDPGFAIRLNHQRSVALEHDDQFMLACELARHAQPIFLDVSDGASDQPRHFAGMRSDHQQPALAAQFIRPALERVQPVGIENDRDTHSWHQGSSPAQTSRGIAKFLAQSPARSSP